MLCVFLFNCHGSQIMFQLTQCNEFMNKYTELADKNYWNISNIAFYLKRNADDPNN